MYAFAEDDTMYGISDEDENTSVVNSSPRRIISQGQGDLSGASFGAGLTTSAGGKEGVV